MSGPPPKQQRRRRNEPAAGEWITLPEGKRPGRRPALPKAKLTVETKEQWAEWWASPMAWMWSAAEVPALRRLLLLVEQFNTALSATGMLEAVKEIRLQEDRFGLSPKGRQQLRWRLPGQVATVTPMRPGSARDEAKGRWGTLQVVD